MRKAFRNPELLLVFRAQYHRFPATESRRAMADIDGHIVDLTFQHADQFPLRPRPLVMQAAQHALGRGGHIALDEAGWKAMLAETFRIPGFKKETPLIPEHRRLYHYTIRKRRLDDFQRTNPRLIKDCRYWP